MHVLLTGDYKLCVQATQAFCHSLSFSCLQKRYNYKNLVIQVLHSLLGDSSL